MLAAGLGIFGLVAAAARFNDKASRVPYVSCFDDACCLACSVPHAPAVEQSLALCTIRALTPSASCWQH